MCTVRHVISLLFCCCCDHQDGATIVNINLMFRSISAISDNKMVSLCLPPSALLTRQFYIKSNPRRLELCDVNGMELRPNDARTHFLTPFPRDICTLSLRRRRRRVRVFLLVTHISSQLNFVSLILFTSRRACCRELRVIR